MTLWTILFRESVDAPTEIIGSVYVDPCGSLPFKVRLKELGQRAAGAWPRYIYVQGRDAERYRARQKKGVANVVRSHGDFGAQ